MALGLGALYNWQLWHCEGASWILWSKRVGFLIWLGWVSLFWAVQDGFFQFPLQELRNQLLVYSQTGQIQDAYHIRLKLQKYPLRFRLVANRSSLLLILYYRPLKEHLHWLVQKFMSILVWEFVFSILHTYFSKHLMSDYFRLHFIKILIFLNFLKLFYFFIHSNHHPLFFFILEIRKKRITN